MSQLKRVVTKRFPAGELPELVRAGIEPDHPVTVVVYEEPEPPIADFETKLDRFWGAAAHLGTTSEEAVARIRALRDERD